MTVTTKADNPVPRKVLDLTGQRFGSRVVLSFFGTDPSNRALWTVKCDCGEVTKALARSLKVGKANRCKSCGNTRHGWCPSGGRTKEWKAWASAIYRCSNPKAKCWKDYGGRGIAVCDEWVKSFQAFIDHIGPKPYPSYQLDRVDNDGNYEPGNVRWASASQNSQNRRRGTTNPRLP